MSRPTAPRYLRCAGKTRKATFCCHKINATTLAVMTLRTVTAVTTSSPWLKAVRAATWLAPIMKAISSKVPKAAPLKPGGEERRGELMRSWWRVQTQAPGMQAAEA